MLKELGSDTKMVGKGIVEEIGINKIDKAAVLCYCFLTQ